MLQKIRENIHEEEIINLVRDMVALPSYPGIPERETAVAEYIFRFFRREGLTAELAPTGGGAKNVLARLPGRGEKPSLLLTTHLDTVPPYDMPYACSPRVEGGKIYGRGAVDAKGPMACMMAAVAALHRAGLVPGGDVFFAGVAGEEGASEGTKALLQSGFKAGAAVVGEPTNFDICTGHRGLEWLEITFEGRTVHGGSQEQGASAILMAMEFMRKTEEELQPRLRQRVHPLVGPATLNYGYIHGGTQPSTIPGHCVLRLDRRWLPGEDYQRVIGELEELLEALRRESPGFKATLRIMEESSMEDGWVHPPAVIDPAHPLVRNMVAACREVLGHEPVIRSFTAWSDAGLLYTYGGIPSVIFAPGNLESAHSSQEHIDIGCLVPGALIYALTALRN